MGMHLIKGNEPVSKQNGFGCRTYSVIPYEGNTTAPNTLVSSVAIDDCRPAAALQISRICRCSEGNASGFALRMAR